MTPLSPGSPGPAPLPPELWRLTLLGAKPKVPGSSTPWIEPVKGWTVAGRGKHGGRQSRHVLQSQEIKLKNTFDILYLRVFPSLARCSPPSNQLMPAAHRLTGLAMGCSPSPPHLMVGCSRAIQQGRSVAAPHYRRFDHYKCERQKGSYTVSPALKYSTLQTKWRELFIPDVLHPNKVICQLILWNPPLRYSS